MKRMLFICTGNYYRSRFSESYFRHLIEAYGLNWTAFSRGLAIHLIGEGISVDTLDMLDRLGVDKKHVAPQKNALTLEDLESADRVIAMSQSEHYDYMTEQFPHWADRIEYWTVEDLHLETANNALAALKKKVEDLVDELNQTS